MLSITLFLVTLLTPLAPPGLTQQRHHLKLAMETCLKGDQGKAITLFLLFHGRYKDSPYAPWALYHAAWLSEVRGDFIAARRNYELLLSSYDHPYKAAIIQRADWLNKGIQSGGPILMKQWREIYEARKIDAAWVARAEAFLGRGRRLSHNSLLRLRVAAWYLQMKDPRRALVHLLEAVVAPDTQVSERAYRAAVPLTLNLGEGDRIRALARLVGASSLPGREARAATLLRLAGRVQLLQRANLVVWGVMGLFLVGLLFPRRKKRYHLLLAFLPAALPIYFIPEMGPVLAVIIVHLALLLWLLGKKRRRLVWGGAFVFMLYTPLLALILTNRFPWSVLL